MIEVLYTDKREPTGSLPLFYLERGYFLKNSTPDAARAVLRERLVQMTASLGDRPPGAMVRLAVFDHRFRKTPEREPVAVLTWRDWKDALPDPPESALELANRQSRFSLPPAVGEAPDAARDAASLSMPPALGETPDAARDAASLSMPPALGETPDESFESAPVSRGSRLSIPPAVGEAPDESRDAAPLSMPPALGETPDVAQSGGASDGSLAAPREEDSGPRSSVPSLPKVEIGASSLKEQGIPVAFERLSELHSQTDVLAGAELLQDVLLDVFPCEGLLIHVLETGTEEFVVVRAVGPYASDMLMHRSAGTDPFFHALMRRKRSLALNPVPEPQDKLRERWQYTGVEPGSVLCGPVASTDGRPLAVIELANPKGSPFNSKNAKALDYVCARFSEFLAERSFKVEDTALGAFV